MVSTEMCGILLMIASGFCVTTDMVTSRMIEESGWPYWYMISGTCMIATMANAMLIHQQSSKLQDMKWVMSRSLLESLHWHSSVLAVIVGAAPGDVAALTSSLAWLGRSTAFFGLIFLGETISMVHFIALILSATGAMFISQPEFLFGHTGGHQNQFGSVLALLSGFFQAASFICARKSQHISVAVLTFSSLLLAVFMSLVPPLLPMVHAGSWHRVVAEPWQAAALMLLLLLLCIFSIALPAAGGTKCPAAVSATVITSSCMVSGYLSQILFFNEVPGLLTLLGASSMLLSVVLMALPAPQKPPPAEPEDGEASVKSSEPWR
eukprot:Skav201764  [mRNA]  locus=scaffold1973:448722:451544:- [translate_table: standard]